MSSRASVKASLMAWTCVRVWVCTPEGRAKGRTTAGPGRSHQRLTRSARLRFTAGTRVRTPTSASTSALLPLLWPRAAAWGARVSVPRGATTASRCTCRANPRPARASITTTRHLSCAARRFNCDLRQSDNFCLFTKETLKCLFAFKGAVNVIPSSDAQFRLSAVPAVLTGAQQPLSRE